MAGEPFRGKAYIRNGCPFSFKFLVFMTEAGLLDEIEIVRLDPNDPGFEATKQKLAEGLGKPTTFPTVEVERGRLMNDSDRVIDYYAERHGVRVADLPVLSFYKETIFPQLVELHRIKTAQK